MGMKQLNETVTRDFAELEVQTTADQLGAWITDRDDSSRQLFCMIAGGVYSEAYVGVYQEGLKTPDGNSLPYALTETGLQVPRGKNGVAFLTFDEVQHLLDKADAVEAIEKVLEFKKPERLEEN